jgi:transcriptional regulator with XRE-family HTH domain
MSDAPYLRLARWLEDQLAAVGENVTDFASRSGINRSVVARWKSGTHRPDIDNARRLAEAVRRPLLEVLVVAEIVTEEEARLQTAKADPGSLTNEQLIGEIRRRMIETERRPALSREEMVAEGITPSGEDASGGGELRVARGRPARAR